MGVMERGWTNRTWGSFSDAFAWDTKIAVPPSQKCVISIIKAFEFDHRKQVLEQLLSMVRLPKPLVFLSCTHNSSFVHTSHAHSASTPELLS